MRIVKTHSHATAAAVDSISCPTERLPGIFEGRSHLKSQFPRLLNVTYPTTALRQARLYSKNHSELDPKQLQNTLPAAVARFLTQGTLIDAERQDALTQFGIRPSSHETAKHPKHATRAVGSCTT